jgi:hypothetical protein
LPADAVTPGSMTAAILHLVNIRRILIVSIPPTTPLSIAGASSPTKSGAYFATIKSYYLKTLQFGEVCYEVSSFENIEDSHSV